MKNKALIVQNLYFDYMEVLSSKKTVKPSFLNLSGLFGAVFENKKKEIFKNLSFSVNIGETICIAGPSGHGKSVFLKIVAGIVKPQRGDFYYFGEYLPLERFSALEVAERQVGLVFQNGALISNLRVRDNIALPLRYHGRYSESEVKEKVNMAMDLMRVRGEADHFPHTLSVGVKKRVAIARAWAMDPKLLLLDEPTSGLDNYNRNNLLPLIDNMRQLFNTTIVIVTHDLLLAEELNSDLVFLQNQKFTAPKSFNEWLNSEESVPRELFRNIRTVF